MSPPLPDTAVLSRLYGTTEVMSHFTGFIRGEVLDFGAGKGKQKQFILSRCPGVTGYTALDVEPHPQVDIVADALNSGLPDARFDTIISNQVMEHVRRPWVMVQEAARMLRSGGHAILTVPFLVPYHAHPSDYFRFTDQGMRSLCTDAGLDVLLCTAHGGLGAVLGEMLRHKCFSPYVGQSRWVRLAGRITESACRKLNAITPPGRVYASVVCLSRKP